MPRRVSSLVRRGSLALLLVLARPSHAGADSVTLVSTRDNTLFEDAEGDTSSGAGPALFCGRNSQGRIRRALVAFDPTAALPTGAHLDSVQLELWLAKTSDPSPRVLRLHRMLADWGEGQSASAGGQGAPAQPDDATWLHAFYPAAPWSAAGGDFAVAPSASLTVLDVGPCAWRSEVLTEDVRGWIAQSTGCFGWALLGDESAPGTARRFESREGPEPSLRPRLILHYTRPTPTWSDSWGRLKARYR